MTHSASRHVNGQGRHRLQPARWGNDAPERPSEYHRIALAAQLLPSRRLRGHVLAAVAAGAAIAALLTAAAVLAARAPEPAPPAVAATTAPPVPSASLGDGTGGAGDGVGDVEPGTYRAPGGPMCNWWILRPGGSVATKGRGGAAQEVMLTSAQRISTGGCGDWVRQ